MSPRLALAIAQARASLDALDLTAENNRLAKLQAERDEFGAAEARAARRREEITKQLAQRDEFNPIAIADQLLESAGSTGTAAPSRLELKHEVEALDRGRNELRRRSLAKGQEIDSLREGARRRFGEALTPIVDAITADARDAAAHLQECQAVLAAVIATAPVGASAKYAVEIAAKATTGNATHHGLLSKGGSVPVPSAIVELLSELDKGPALSVRVIRQTKV